MKESIILHQILEYLPYLNVYPIRINSGRVMTKNNHLFKGAPAGTPDIIGVLKPSGRMVAIEVKQPGNKPTDMQKVMHQKLREYGAICFVATSIEDVQIHLTKDSYEENW